MTDSAEKRGIAALTSVAATVVITAAFWLLPIDQTLQRFAFSAASPHWPLATALPWRALHDYGTWPGIALIAAAAIGSIAGGRWRRASLYVLLVAIVGAGIVTNTLGKALCGRARPDAVIGFGGPLPFQRPFELAAAGRGYSFLCGHASMGFLFCALFFVLRGWGRWAALLGGLAFGLLLGAGRVLSGTHWTSDVLLDATLMLAVAALLAPVARDGLRLPPVAWAVIAIAAALLFRYGTPVHKEQDFAIAHPVSRLVVHAETRDVRMARGAETRVQVFVDGEGWPGAGVRNALTDHGAEVELASRLRGRYWSVREHVVVTAPNDVEVVFR
jgi:membrane-associated PAP2 superfamily phosphatase